MNKEIILYEIFPDYEEIEEILLENEEILDYLANCSWDVQQDLVNMYSNNENFRSEIDIYIKSKLSIQVCEYYLKNFDKYEEDLIYNPFPEILYFDFESNSYIIDFDLLKNQLLYYLGDDCIFEDTNIIELLNKTTPIKWQ